VRNLRFLLAYDGTDYAGWQVQPGRRTVQGVLETILSHILNRSHRVVGSGRTDAGVHARGQVASVVTDRPLPIDRLLPGLNALLPWDLRVLAVDEMPPGFHARRSALGKEYRYQIVQAPLLSPFLYRYAWHLRRPLDLEAMNEAAGHLVGFHDYSSFVSAGGQADHHHRRVTAARFDRASDDRIVLTVVADGFLYHMVRNLLGTLVEVGAGRRHPDDLPVLLAARDRRLAGPTAPARGLFLQQVMYPEGTSQGGLPGGCGG
jgi:tRNA pseudouridine38-40 synthase